MTRTILLGALLTLAGAAPAAAQRYEKRSPFEAIRWEGEAPRVRLKRVWYELISIDGNKTATILAFCKQRYGRNWDKRFCEDLVQALSEMGHPPQRTVTLVVRDLNTKTIKTFRDVALSKANRDAIRDARPRVGGTKRTRPRAARIARRVRRPHSKTPAPAFLWLTRRHWKAKGPLLERAQAEADLDQLEWHLKHTFSYLTRTGVKYEEALDTIRAKLGPRIAQRDLHIQLRKLVALFGDGHSRVRGVWRALPRGYLPCAVADVRGRVAALEPGRRALLDPKHPYLTAIDGVALAKWLEAARRLVAKASPQFRRRGALTMLSALRYLRAELGLKHAPQVALTLSSADGKRAARISRPVAARPAFRLRPPRRKHTVLKGNVGYLRLASMSSSTVFLLHLDLAMSRAADTRGLIIDVRGNGGGTRHALRRLFPYFIGPQQRPRVANVAAYRLPPRVAARRPEGYLADRYLFPAGHAEWSRPARGAIAAFAQGFRPKWTLPAGGFSGWHYLVLERRDGIRHYDKPVVLLVDGGCFSATDVFVGAFKGWPKVTLLGTPTSGGSGRSRSVRLTHSDIEVRLSTMASFLPSGHLYEGRGVPPDVLARPTLKDVLGKGDSVLSAALERLRRK